jgi:RNA polymerase sigma-70 factor, ECF subfamily
MEDGRTDEALIEAGNRGETAAMEALYFRYRAWVFGVARKITGENGDAEEVAQDVFAYFFGRFPGFGLSSNLKSHLYPVIKNTALDLIRRRKLLAVLAEETVAAQAEPNNKQENTMQIINRMLLCLVPLMMCGCATRYTTPGGGGEFT